MLNIHRISFGSRALGPGLRYVIWTQGCPFRCEGCLTPEGQNTEPFKLVDITSLAKDIIERKEIEGITISGGEPFIQADKIYDVLRMVKAERPELNVICFTGYRIQQLTKPDQLQLLEMIDLLIDGPFERDKNNGRGLRGSTNQQLHFLTGRLTEYKEELENGKRKIEIIVGDKTLVQIGIPTPQK